MNHNFSDKDRLHGYYVLQHDLRQEPTQGASIAKFGDTRESTAKYCTLAEASHSPNRSE